MQWPRGEQRKQLQKQVQEKKVTEQDFAATVGGRTEDHIREIGCGVWTAHLHEMTLDRGTTVGATSAQVSMCSGSVHNLQGRVTFFLTKNRKCGCRLVVSWHFYNIVIPDNKEESRI